MLESSGADCNAYQRCLEKEQCLQAETDAAYCAKMTLSETRHLFSREIYAQGQDANKNTQCANVQWSQVGRMDGLTVGKSTEVECSRFN